MIKTSELKQKEVINVNNGERLGLIRDIELDLKAGKIESIIVPGEKKVWSFFAKDNDLIIAWDQVEKIGEDVVLVNLYDLKEFNNDT
ncbi:YlmC/YmxH family sporulation protein [Fuchsiella alkaliacetigena]|uniref:YlmC/YmxH family sporulation protein n=1 Tax=Fuchsiella alkaliacetigena TaxID=957042 RepID=UPI00200B3AD4|nr:YlmC/YmxH family sporulation protein [Fuchsiella alkaliacetigena]MCK8823710.1 YlmC/YmxH family sporulation protein [Fuchsiella alkaliacetigena]